MSNFVKIICPVCGQSEYHKKDDVFVCDYCETPFFTVDAEEQQSINEAHNAHALYKFTKADDLYRTLLENTKSDEVKVTCHLGRLLAYFGIVYVHDFNGNQVVTFTNYDPNYKSIKESSFYKAIESSTYFCKYKDMLDHFDKEYQNIGIELSKKIKYDIFICVKVSQRTKNNQFLTGYTADSKIADTIYHELVKKGLRVFYSEKTLSGIDYDAQIYSALMQSSNLLLISSKKEYLESAWVESEWRRWLSFIQYDLKEKNSLYLYRPDTSYELPLVLKKIQSFDDSLSLINVIEKNIMPVNLLNSKNEKNDLEKELNIVKTKIIFKKYKEAEDIYMRLCEEFMDYRPWLGLFELLILEKVEENDERLQIYYNQALNLCKDEEQKACVNKVYNKVFKKQLEKRVDNEIIQTVEPKKIDKPMKKVLTKDDYYNQALDYEQEGKEKEAFINYQKAADLGHAIAQNNLGYCYDNGYGVKKDLKQAVLWYRKAASQGLEIAQYNLGFCYENGEGVTKDLKEAKFWYEKSAEKKYANAIKALESIDLKITEEEKMAGENYYKAALNFENKKMMYSAFENYKKAAELGHVISQNNLGYCYDNGEGVGKDSKKAVYWYQKAADEGLDSAQYNLGFCYEEGIGVIRDIDLAIKWYEKAAINGNKNAKERLNILK